MKIITNCPNCGAPLEKLKCHYCGTEIRYSNEINLFDGKCELLLRHNQGNKVVLMPVVGYISQIELVRDYDSCRSFDGRIHYTATNPQIEFSFVGTMGELK